MTAADPLERWLFQILANEMWKLHGGHKRLLAKMQREEDDARLMDKMQREDAYEKMVEVARFAIAADQLVPATARDRLWHLVSDAGQHLGLRLAEVCETLYEAQGPSAIYDFVLATRPETPWLDCEPCDVSTPHHEGTCLVCSTPREDT